MSVTDNPIYVFNTRATIEIELEAEDMEDAEVKLRTLIEHGVKALSEPSTAGRTDIRIECTETRDINLRS